MRTRFALPPVNWMAQPVTVGKPTRPPRKMGQKNPIGQSSQQHSMRIVLAAIMKMKRDEFKTLRQDHLSMQSYLNKFTQLARYAPSDIPDEKEKIDKFLGGLNDTLRGPLIIQDH
ncbi:hypothetical protein E2562_019653, partial [Oryza meyeriana var. granulata]